MSFKIHSQTAAACPTFGVQERNAHDRRHPHRLVKHEPKALVSTDSEGDATNAQVSSAIRRAQDSQAVLSDALIFLQTQDEALGRLQTLLSDNAALEARSLESITAETFNGMALFGQANTADVIRFEDLETQDAAEIERPAMPTSANLENPQTLKMRIDLAREKNHREQIHIEQMMEYDRAHAISEDFHLGHLSTAVEASHARDFSRETLLLNGRIALELQANAQQESVFRLFH
jgi:hypothetical protein